MLITYANSFIFKAFIILISFSNLSKFIDKKQNWKKEKQSISNKFFVTSLFEKIRSFFFSQLFFEKKLN